MSPQFKKILAFSVGVVASLSLVSALFVLLWLRDVQSDRRHTIKINSATPVFAGSGEGGCRGIQMTTVERGANLPVRRIRYMKECAAIDIALPDGRQGYIVLGIGDISVNPPLPKI
jgi:hypothetical protein